MLCGTIIMPETLRLGFGVVELHLFIGIAKGEKHLKASTIW